MQSFRNHFSDKSFVLSFLSGGIFLIISLIIQFLTSNYATRVASDSVTDIVLSNIRIYAVDGVFVWGSVVLLCIGIFLGLRQLNYVPFTLKSIALFTLIRSVFVSLTHISLPAHVLISSVFFRDAFFNGIFSGNDLFFSGHTGLPFLIALMVWDNKKLRFLFLGFSLLFAVVVLLGHLHYSIDVLSAYFITYAIFHICIVLFKKDWELFLKK